MMGRPRRPTRLKELSGTLRPSRVNPLEPTPAVEVPSMPRAFRGREAGKEWRRVTKALKDMRVIARADRGVIAAWSIAWENLMASYEQVAQYGAVVKGPHGGPQLSPFLLTLSMSAKQLRGLAPELGLSPASRSRLSAVPGDPPLDRFEAFLRARPTGRPADDDAADDGDDGDGRGVLQ